MILDPTARRSATVSLSGSATLPKHAGLHCDIRIYGDEGCLLFDTERGRLDLLRLDGKDESLSISPQDAAYDGARPVRRFAEICAGKPVVNASNAECGVRVTETLDALYRSNRSGALERVGG